VFCAKNTYECESNNEIVIGDHATNPYININYVKISNKFIAWSHGYRNALYTCINVRDGNVKSPEYI